MLHNPSGSIPIARNFLEELQSILVSGNFVKVDIELGFNEHVVGEMTVYENALFTYANKYQGKIKTLGATHMYNGKYIGPAEYFNEFNKIVGGARYRTDTAKELLWGSIRERLHSEITNDAQFPYVGLREKSQIVLMQSNQIHVETHVEAAANDSILG